MIIIFYSFESTNEWLLLEEGCNIWINVDLTYQKTL